MKFITFLTTCFFMLFVLLPTTSHADKKDTDRSTSLGTGLPTSKEKYERKQLTPKPTKKMTTDYEIVDDDETTEEMLATNTSTTDQNKTTEGNSQTTPNKSTKETTAPAEKITSANEQTLTTLPQTGIQKNYPAIIGTIIVILAVILFFIFRKKKR